MTAKTPETGGFDGYYDANGIERVRIGDLGNGDYGLVVRDPTGLFEIIDGVSDVLTIVASGTLSLTVADGAQGTDINTHPELGTLADPPVLIAGIKPPGGLGYYPNPYLLVSNGATVLVQLHAHVIVGVPAGLVTVEFVLTNESSSSATFDAHYLILRQLGV